MLRFLTSGESHGKALVAVLEGMVSGLDIEPAFINEQLQRRQQGYGRGGRMTIEKDQAEILSGVRFGQTIGAPIALMINNRDFKIDELPVIKRPRPGHADLAGVLKYDRQDARDVLERSSARETTARVAVGAICKKFLLEFGIDITSHVVKIGGIGYDSSQFDFDKIKNAAEISPMRCADEAITRKMMQRVDEAKTAKDTIGGIFEVLVKGCPVGLGSYVHYDRRLSAKLCAAVMSIQAIKGVEIGMGFGVADVPGRQVHDEIYYDKSNGFYRNSNHAGGFEGGMTNGQIIVLRAAAKPYATLMDPMNTVHLESKQNDVATVERSDVTAVPACGVVAEAMVAHELATAMLEKFGGDSLAETRANHQAYLRRVLDY